MAMKSASVTNRKNIIFYTILICFSVHWSTDAQFIRVKDSENEIKDTEKNHRDSKSLFSADEDFYPPEEDYPEELDQHNFILRTNTTAARFINPLNPFDIFGNPYCQHQGLDGMCYEIVRCLALAGKVGPLCRGFRGMCCRFLRDCGQRSSQEIVYWSNHNRWDKDKKKNSIFQGRKGKKHFADPASICEFKLIKRTRHYCGLRVEPHIYPKDAFGPPAGDLDESQSQTAATNPCLDMKMSILGLGDRLELSLCSERDSINVKKYDIDISAVDEVKLTLTPFSRSDNPVDVRIVQLKCTEFNGEDLSGVSTGSTGFGLPSTTTEIVPIPDNDTDATSIVITEGSVVSPPAPPVTVITEGSVVSPPAPPVTVITESVTTDATVVEITSPEPDVRPPAPPVVVPPVPTVSPVQPSPPAPPPIPPLPNYSRCGIKGLFKRRKRGERDDLIHLINSLRNKMLSNNRSSNSWDPFASIRNNSNELFPVGPPVPDNELDERRNRVDWAVPQNDESIFHYFMGNPSIVSTRITYGRESSPKEYPWQVAMFVGGSRFSCGGSIIGDFYILTAAHCVISQQTNPGAIKFNLGDWDLRTTSDTHHQEVFASRITVHPNYSRSNLQNDIAVVKVNRRIEFNDGIRPICLPTQDLDLTGQLATITGWGRDEHGQLVSRMHELTALIMSNDECGRRWGGNRFIVNSMMCMDSQSGDSCNGDSGGPSVMEHPNGSGKYYQVGIVSFGSGSCTDKSLPGVYTRITKFRDWIRSQMN